MKRLKIISTFTLITFLFFNLVTITGFVSFYFYISCNSSVNNKTNFLVEGTFYGYNNINSIDDNNDIATYYLKWSHDIFKSNGVDVIQDLVKPSYYSLVFIRAINKTKVERIAFYNLKDSSFDTTHYPIKYTDDNGTTLFPYFKSGYEESGDYAVYNTALGFDVCFNHRIEEKSMHFGF